MDSSLSDIRDGVRRLLNREGVSSFVILALALCIGINTTVFTVKYAVTMNSLPRASPAELVAHNNPTEEGTGEPRMGTFSYQADHYLHDHNQRLQHVCVTRTSASLSKRKAGAKSGTLAARTHRTRNRDVTGTTCHAQKGIDHGHFNKDCGYEWESCFLI